MKGDTDARADARYHELLRGMTPGQRAAQTASLTNAVRELAAAGIRHRHPGASEREVKVRLTVRLYGRTVAERLFGDVPEDAV